MKKNTEPKTKKRFKKRYWVLLPIIMVLLLVLLATHRPASYKPLAPPEDNKPSPYLTSVLMPNLYNGAQRGEPFELIVTEKGINDMISRQAWPLMAGDFSFSAMQVIILDEHILIMATATAGDANFLISTQLWPAINEQGLLNLHISDVKIGAVNITLIARLISRTIYAERLNPSPEDMKRQSVQITRSVINDIPFDPVFEIDDIKLRIAEAQILQGKIRTILVPIE